MAFCKNCGTELTEGTKFCPSCGSAIDETIQTQQAQQQQNKSINDFISKVSSINDTTDTTSDFDSADIEQNKGISVLSYFGILFLVPYLSRKESKFAQFHAKQGFNLFLTYIAFIIVNILLHLIQFTKTQYVYGYPIGEVEYTPWFVTLICTLLGLCVFALAIIGIINAVSGKAKELPLIGKIKILK